MPQLAPTIDPTVDNFYARNNTKIYLAICIAGGAWARVGRVQSMREDVNNNVQVLSELGRDYTVELKKGITVYSFSIARFYTRRDVMDNLKRGQIFALQIRDSATLVQQAGGGGAEVLEHFERCAITSISRDFTAGQAAVGENATVVIAGKGLAGQPQQVAVA